MVYLVVYLVVYLIVYLMVNLIHKLEGLLNSPIKKDVDSRIKELKKIRTNKNNAIFKELCFCLLTANYDAAKAIRIQNSIGDGFLTLSQTDLASKLKELGYRFPNVRSKYIVEARVHQSELIRLLESTHTEHYIREWLVNNVKGLGFKESSHFLRNIGCTQCAIIDFHIVDILVAHKIIKKPKALNKKVYLDIEKQLRNIGKKVNLNMSELDFYLWYLETGKVLK